MQAGAIVVGQWGDGKRPVGPRARLLLTAGDIALEYVEGKVVLELKSVERTTAAHRKQIQTYLRLSGCKLGFLLNFGEALMKDGITRAVNGLDEDEHRWRKPAKALTDEVQEEKISRAKTPRR